MAASFDAVFAPSSLSLRDALLALEPVLEEREIVYQGEVMPLADVGGSPGVTSALSDRAETLADVATLAERWWGVSLSCIATPMWRTHGPSDAAEVYISLFKKGRRGGLHVKYNENKTAYQTRRRDPDHAAWLYGLLLRMCAALRSQGCYYDEESMRGFQPVTIDLLRDILRTRRFPSHGYDGVVIVSADQMTLEEARGYVEKGKVALSTTGYLLFQLL